MAPTPVRVHRAVLDASVWLPAPVDDGGNPSIRLEDRAQVYVQITVVALNDQKPLRVHGRSSLSAHLLNHLVRPRQHGPWDGQPERLRGLQVEGQFELGRLLDRQVRRPGALRILMS